MRFGVQCDLVSRISKYAPTTGPRTLITARPAPLLLRRTTPPPRYHYPLFGIIRSTVSSDYFGMAGVDLRSLGCFQRAGFCLVYAGTWLVPVRQREVMRLHGTARDLLMCPPVIAEPVRGRSRSQGARTPKGESTMFRRLSTRVLATLLVASMLVVPGAIVALGAEGGTGPADALSPTGEWMPLADGQQVWYAFNMMAATPRSWCGWLCHPATPRLSASGRRRTCVNGPRARNPTRSGEV